MAAQIFGAQAAVAALNIIFSNTSLGNAIYNQQVATATSQLQPGADAGKILSYASFAQNFGAAFANQTPAALAHLLLVNLGLAPTSSTFLSLEPVLADYIAKVGTSQIGVVALQIADIFSTLETATGAQAVFNAAAVAWNNTIAAAYLYSSNPTHTSPIVGTPEVSTGQTFTLTNGIDVMPGLIGSDGNSSTTGNDTVSAILLNSGTNGSTNESTLSSADVINAGAGTDVFNVRVVSLTSSLSVAPVISNTESVLVSNQDQSGNNAAINLVSASGIAQAGLKDTAAGSNTTFLNLATTVVYILNNADGTADGQKVNFGSPTGRSGSTDAFSVSIENGTGSATAVAGFNLVTTNGTNDDTSFETANVSVAGAASFVSAGSAMAGLTTINVAGSVTGVASGYGLTLTQAQNFSSIKTIDASGIAGGGLNVDARASTTAGVVFTGSSSDDRVVLENTTINTASKLDGGAGKDTLASTSFNLQAAAVNSAVGFEVLESVNPASSLDASSFTSIHEFLFSGGPTNGRVNITGVESNDRFVFSSNQGNSDDAVRFTGASIGNAAVFELRAASATNGQVSIESNTNSNSDTATIGFRNGISSVSIYSTGQNTNPNLIQPIVNGSSHVSAFGNDNGLANFTILGTQDLTIAAKPGVDLSSSGRTSGFSNAANVDASGFSGNLRIAGSNSNDVIKGGSGNDIIYGVGGSNTLTGGAGADQFRLVRTNGTDSIKDFLKGTDKIGSNNLDFANTTATSAGATLSSQDYIENRTGITSMGTSDKRTVVELQSALSNNQIQSDLGAAIDAYVLVFNSTTGKGELWFDNDWSNTDNRSHVVTFDNVIDLVGLLAFKNTDFVEFIA